MAVILTSTAAFFILQPGQLVISPRSNTSASDPAIEIELDSLVDQVGKIINLPANEQPTIATVTDLEKLNNQKFFDQAEIGDKVLVYMQAKKAYLYRPSANKLIEAAPVSQ